MALNRVFFPNYCLIIKTSVSLKVRSIGFCQIAACKKIQVPMVKIFTSFIINLQIFTLSWKFLLTLVLRPHDLFWIIYGIYETLKSKSNRSYWILYDGPEVPLSLQQYFTSLQHIFTSLQHSIYFPSPFFTSLHHFFTSLPNCFTFFHNFFTSLQTFFLLSFNFFLLPFIVFGTSFHHFFRFPSDFFYFPSLFFTSFSIIFYFPSPFFVLLFGIFPPSVFLLPFSNFKLPFWNMLERNIKILCLFDGPEVSLSLQHFFTSLHHLFYFLQHFFTPLQLF